MLQLTDDQKAFLKRYKIPLSALFDATGLKTQEYHDIMKGLDKLYAIGVTPCKAYGHTMRTRNGHCLQCKPETITYLNRYYANSNVYIAVSMASERIKVGYTKDIKEREQALRNTVYAGNDDWKIAYYISCKNAGKIESEIQSKLSEYYSPSEYKLGNNIIACYEVFSCSYKKAKEVINELKDELPEEFNNEVEVKNAEDLFNFQNIETSNNRKGNRDNDKEPASSSLIYESDPLSIRKSEFSEDLNQIINPEALEIDSANTNRQIKNHKYIKKIKQNSEFKEKLQKECGVYRKRDGKRNFSYFTPLLLIVLIIIIYFFITTL